MLPRLLLRNVEVESTACLDLGTMEGLIPTLLARRGARRVLAVDAVDHSIGKVRAVRHYHRVDFEYRSIGLMYDLATKLDHESFDVVNGSGLLYHVFSPLHVLAGVRPLLKRNGILIVSTNVIDDDDFVMEFNNGGRLQEETNTFWYVSVPLLDYQLRYLKLAPIDCLYLPQPPVDGQNTGYVSIACRAVDDILPEAHDTWMRKSAAQSWEHRQLVDWKRAARQPRSSIEYRVPEAMTANYRADTGTLDLVRAVRTAPPTVTAAEPADGHFLGLEHRA